jgi:hypothetical protein
MSVSYRPIRVSLILRALICLGIAALTVWGTCVGWTAGRSGLLTAGVLLGCGGFFAFVGTGYLSQVFSDQNLQLEPDGFSYRFAWK